MKKRLGNSSRKEDYLGIMCLINFFLNHLLELILLFHC